MLPPAFSNVPFKWHCGSKGKRHHHKLHCTVERTQIRVLQFALNWNGLQQYNVGGVTNACNKSVKCYLRSWSESGARNGRFYWFFGCNRGRSEGLAFQPRWNRKHDIGGYRGEFDQQQQQGMRPASQREGRRRVRKDFIRTLTVISYHLASPAENGVRAWKNWPCASVRYYVWFYVWFW